MCRSATLFCQLTAESTTTELLAAAGARLFTAAAAAARAEKPLTVLMHLPIIAIGVSLDMLEVYPIASKVKWLAKCLPIQILL